MEEDIHAMLISLVSMKLSYKFKLYVLLSLNMSFFFLLKNLSWLIM